MDDDADFVSLAPKDAPPARPRVGYAGDNDIQPVNRPILSTSFNSVPKEGGSGGVWGDVTRGLGLGTRNAIEGLSSLPGTIADVMTYPTRQGLRWAGLDVTAPSDLLNKGLTATGLPTPQTPAENLNAEIVRGGASMVTPMGVGALAPRAVAALPGVVQPLVTAPRAAGQVVAGGVGGGLGDVAATRDEVPDWLKPAARLAGNVGGAGLTSALTGIGGTIKNAVQGVQSPIAQALERLGIKPGTVGAVTERPGVSSLEAAATKAPIASGIVQPAQQRTVDQFDDSVRRTALSLNPATTAEEAGMQVQRALHDWKTNVFPAEQNAVWAPLNQRLAGTAVDPGGYRRALEATAKDPALNSLPEIQRSFVNKKITEWLDALNADVGTGKSLSWEQAQAIKRRIGDQMGTPEIVASIGGQALKRIYGGLAEGMENTATQHGQGRLFHEANQTTIDGHQFIDGTLSKGVQANNLSQETIRSDAAARALLTDNTAMQQLRARVPEAADALAAYKLHASKEAKPSSQTDASTPSTGTFLTEMRKHQLNYPEGSAALFASNPQAKQNLDDLLAAAAQLRRTERNLNTSNTTQAALWSTLPLQAMQGYSMGGIPGAIALPAATLGSTALAGKGLTNPALIALAAARRGERLPFGGLLGGALSDLATAPREEGR